MQCIGSPIQLLKEDKIFIEMQLTTVECNKYKSTVQQRTPGLQIKNLVRSLRVAFQVVMDNQKVSHHICINRQNFSSFI